MSFLDLSPSPPEGDSRLGAVDEEDTVNNQLSSSTMADTMKEVYVPAPVPCHPIPSMQEAFAESFQDANGSSTPAIPASRPGTAAARRNLLLDQDVDEETHAARWKQRPGQKYHELWKLMAQISFGIYLLLNGIARDEDQVIKILQAHVDEVDDFLETTLEDFDLAQEDIEERLKLLKLPLENIFIFDAMLEDRNFRVQIVGGNEKIEHVITRTANAMKDALKDVQQGMEACKEFASWLGQEQHQQARKRGQQEWEKVLDVFDAMKGNVDGWYNAYVSLQTKGNSLGVACVQLGSIVAEMDRRAGEISRKTRFSTMPLSELSPPASPPQEARMSKLMRQSMSKNLPSDPNPITPAIRATLPAFSMVHDRERTPEPEPESNTPAELDAEVEAPFILKPYTYSPIPSPVVRPQEPKEERLSPTVFQQPLAAPTPPPEMPKRSSLRKRFSLGKKEPSLEPKKMEPRKIEIRKVESKQMEPRRMEPRKMEPQKTVEPGRMEGRQSPRIQPAGGRIVKPPQETIANPPSRGLDSAYSSDFDAKASPLPIGVISHHQPTQSRGNNIRISTLEYPPNLAARNSSVLPSPKSDQQQYFRPVMASPHSPLQRPWTAGTASQHSFHTHSNSSSSNLSRPPFTHSHTPSNLGYSRGAPSAMGMSMTSEITLGVDESGNKIRKKRSAFGWFKKAFSLSEEEKAAFEEKKQMKVDMYADYAKPPEQQWLDGKRVDPGARPRRKPVPMPLNTKASMSQLNNSRERVR